MDAPSDHRCALPPPVQELLAHRFHVGIGESGVEELALKAQLSPLPPVVLGGLLVIPQGLLDKVGGRSPEPTFSQSPAPQPAAAHARKVILDIECSLGFEPVDRELEKLGYDIESRVPGTGRLRFIEVKGRITGASTIIVTRNEILYFLNKPDNFILAIVDFMPEDQNRVHYVRRPFQREPYFCVTSVNYDFSELLAKAVIPS